MGSDFWAKKLGGIAQPLPPAQQPPAQGAWWQPPQPPPQQQYGYPQQQGYDPALQAQMPYQPGPTGPNGMPQQEYVNQLLSIPADQLNQQQMEEIAAWELGKAKYNASCPQCGSANFAPQGTRLGNTTLGSDKCFDCGASSSTYTSSPEPARGGGGKSKAAWRDVRQIDTGGAGGASMYLKFRGTPASYMPRG